MQLSELMSCLQVKLVLTLVLTLTRWENREGGLDGK